MSTPPLATLHSGVKSPLGDTVSNLSSTPSRLADGIKVPFGVYFTFTVRLER